MQIDLIPDFGVLILSDYLGSVADFAAEHILQRLVAVEAAAALPNLSDPGPDRFRGDGDVHAERVGPFGLRYEFVAGKRIVSLAAPCAPAKAFPSYEWRGEDVPRYEAAAFESGKKPNAWGMCACGHESDSIPLYPKAHATRNVSSNQVYNAVRAAAAILFRALLVPPQ